MKPLLRGALHQWAAVFAAGAGCTLVALAPDARTRIAAAVYSLSLALLFGVSAVYHRFQWSARVRTWLRRADHASIFLLIGGTYTPIALLGIGGDTGTSLLVAIWSGVSLGVGVSLLWPGAPKLVSALIAIAVGWTIVPYLGDVYRALTALELWLIASGGIVYTLGGLVYALRRPNPWPRVFGYHEVFHAMTLVGAGLHLASILHLVHAAA
jgi:hemolysin III